MSNLLNIIKENLKSSDKMTLKNHFHSPHLGCDTIYMPICSTRKNISGRIVRRVIRQVYCKTHKKFCSYSGDSCGWEWGWYGGTKTDKPEERFKRRKYEQQFEEYKLKGTCVGYTSRGREKRTRLD